MFPYERSTRCLLFDHENKYFMVNGRMVHHENKCFMVNGRMIHYEDVAYKTYQKLLHINSLIVKFHLVKNDIHTTLKNPYENNSRCSPVLS